MRKRAKHTILLFTLLAGITWMMGMNSCTKQSTIETPFNMLVGDWKLVATATDDNLNGVMDPEEVQSWPIANTELLKFNPDSTGNESKTFDNITTNYSFHWSFHNSFHEISRSYSAKTTMYSHLDLLTPTDMHIMTMDTVYYDSSNIANWKIYKKK
jgi:hypothetical protein